MKNFLIFLLLILAFQYGGAQERILQLRNNIDVITPDAPGLNEKVNINIKEAPLSSFLLAISEIHKLNFSVDSSLSKINLVNNFSDVVVGDLLIFLCKEYSLTIDFTGNIMSIKPYLKPQEKAVPNPFVVEFDAISSILSLDIKDEKLYSVFKKIMDETGRNLVFVPGMENQLLTSYIKNMPLDAALQKLAYGNNLILEKSRDNFYMFEPADVIKRDGAVDSGSKLTKPVRPRKSNFYFKVLDSESKLLEVDFENTPIGTVINDIGNELSIDMFISSPLENAGTATVKAKGITFDDLLKKMFEIRQQGTLGILNAKPGGESTSEESYNYLKSGSIYYFGIKSQLLVRTVKSIPLLHRSIELLSDPTREGRSAGRLNGNNTSFAQYNNEGRGMQMQQNTVNPSTAGQSESILKIIPDEIKVDLDIKIDKELNSFIINGPNANIERFESFIKYIDKAVPVILIEVMLLEINRSATIETGIKAGLGNKPTATAGTVYPNVDMTLGANTINNIINHFDGFGSLNVGEVLPDFYLSIKAQEANGNLKIRSSPRLSTLNGHKAYLSIGETTYYVVTNQNFYGSQIPQASEVKNYQPVDAELSVTIMPLVSGDGQITLDIKVIQSSFNGQKVDKDAPPGINSREFTSIIRVRDQDLIVLGGLEEKVKNDSGSGVPLLARIPIIKWLFSSRKREDSKRKLTVLIKPTVLY